MDSKVIFEYEWPYLLTFLPSEEELERTAKEFGAMQRKRGVRSASALLRLALAYGFCGLTLRQTAAWAQLANVAELSDVALLNRLRKSSDWLGSILALKLAEKAPPPPLSSGGFRVCLVDASTISRPGSKGTDWRIHLGFNLRKLTIDQIELTNVSGGESLTRFTHQPGEVVIGDRGYANRRGFASVLDAGGDFIVRINWQNVPLQKRAGGHFDLIEFLRRLPEAEVGECPVLTAPLPRAGIPAFPTRLVGVRKTEAAAEVSRKKVLKVNSRKGRSVDPRTLETAGYAFVLTSLSPDKIKAREVLELYRFRWQVELAFKRLKSLLHLDDLQARDPPLARSFLFSKLIAALLLEDLTNEFLSFSPWGHRLAQTTSVPVADTESPS